MQLLSKDDRNMYSVPPEQMCHRTMGRLCPSGKKARSLHEEVGTELSLEAALAGFGQEDRQQGHSREAVE